MQAVPEYQPRWYELIAYTLGGVAVGISLAIILWL
jgi:hypothetical protein